MIAQGDARLLRLVISNLLSNSWKFPQNKETGRIEFGQTEIDHHKTYYVRDNGVGF